MHARLVASNDRETRLPREVEARSTDYDIKIESLSRPQGDALGSDFINVVEHDAYIGLIHRFQIANPWRAATVQSFSFSKTRMQSGEILSYRQRTPKSGMRSLVNGLSGPSLFFIMSVRYKRACC